MKHIIVCGHYDCALIDKGDGSVLGGWHKFVPSFPISAAKQLTVRRNVTKLHALNESYLRKSDSSLDYECRHRKLEEVYVLAEIDWLKRQENVRKAIEEDGLQIHAFVYDKQSNECFRLVVEQ